MGIQSNIGFSTSSGNRCRGYRTAWHVSLSKRFLPLLLRQASSILFASVTTSHQGRISYKFAQLWYEDVSQLSQPWR